jgi:hypothetical protein
MLMIMNGGEWVEDAPCKNGEEGRLIYAGVCSAQAILLR